MVHAFTSFAVVAAIGHYAWTRQYLEAAPGGARYVLILTAAGLALGLVWEIAEALALKLSWSDTVADLVLDTLGAAAGGLLAGWVILRQRAPRTQRPSQSPA